MYCPKCNQSQASDDMRYCSRCGFPLSTVSLLLQNDGVLPRLPKQRAHQSSRARMATESVILTLFSWSIGLLATLLFDFGGPFETVAKMAAVIFLLLGLIGLFRFLYAFLFVKGDPETDQTHHSRQVMEQERLVLPSPQQTPLSDFPRKANTKEMVRPLSVTENTTRLLDDADSNYERQD